MQGKMEAGERRGRTGEEAVLGRGIMGPNKHESFPCSNIHLYTLLAVLTVAPAWRSFLTTLEWPLEDASISAVSPI